ETRDPRRISLRLERPGLLLRSPETVQVFRDAEKRQSRAAAAYVDPRPFERPLVRALAFPAAPAGGGQWDTLLAVSFPAKARPGGTDIDVRAVIRREHRTVDEYKRRIHVDPPPGGGDTRPVTVMGRAKLPNGSHEMTVVLGETKGQSVDAA